MRQTNDNASHAAYNREPDTADLERAGVQGHVAWFPTSVRSDNFLSKEILAKSSDSADKMLLLLTYNH
jgi:hypothetical protein